MSHFEHLAPLERQADRERVATGARGEQPADAQRLRRLALLSRCRSGLVHFGIIYNFIWIVEFYFVRVIVACW